MSVRRYLKERAWLHCVRPRAGCGGQWLETRWRHCASCRRGAYGDLFPLGTLDQIVDGRQHVAQDDARLGRDSRTTSFTSHPLRLLP